MSVQAASWARAIGKVHNQGRPLRQAVLNELADHANADGYCYPSMQRLAENTCMSYSSVRRELSALESMGIVTRRRRRGEDGKQGGYEYWLQMQQGDLLAPPADDPAFTQSGGHSEHSEGQPPLSVSATSVHCEHRPPLSVSGQNRQAEPSKEPSGESLRAPERESGDGERRELHWRKCRLDISHAPADLSDEALIEWLDWRRERLRAPCNQTVVTRACRELAQCVADGWEANEALAACMGAGWKEPCAQWLRNRFAEGSAGSRGGAAATTRSYADRMARREEARQRQRETTDAES